MSKRVHGSFYNYKDYPYFTGMNRFTSDANSWCLRTFGPCKSFRTNPEPGYFTVIGEWAWTTAIDNRYMIYFKKAEDRFLFITMWPECIG